MLNVRNERPFPVAAAGRSAGDDRATPGKERAGVRDENQQYEASVRELVEGAALVTDVGYSLVAAGPGWCAAELRVLPRHLHLDGFVHAGVLATMADHTAGGAALTVTEGGRTLLTVEFKINLLRPGRGERLVCESRVLKPGRTLIVVESEVHGLEGGERTLISKATVTLAALDRRGSEGQPA